jgi:uncharacterized protein (DUF58 family)
MPTEKAIGLSSDVLAKVRQIEILTGRLVAETFAGEYLSVFKGHGMEFAEVREYSPGDDVRAIDRNVTARMSKPYIRQYTEERELTVVIACDLSKSQFFGSAALKKEIAAELAAVLAFSALKNNDKVGLLLFTENVEEFIPPKKGRKHILHLIRDVLAYEPKKNGTRLDLVLETISRVLRRHCIVFLISDFRTDKFPSFEHALRLGGLKHDLIPIILTDPREKEIPRFNALIELHDPESGREVLFDAASKESIASHRKEEENRLAKLQKLFQLSGLDYIRVGTDSSYIDPVAQFFQRRARKLSR